jgi:hypothetical protein
MITTCNATQKFGGNLAVCDLSHGHTGNHRATLFPTDRVVEWGDDWYQKIADAVVNPK